MDADWADLQRRLAGLADDSARLIYISAIPLWLDREVLIALHEGRAQAVEALRILEQLSLLNRVADGRAVIRADVRRLLFRVCWRDHPPDFAAAHRRMAVYCRDRAAQVEDDAQAGFRWARAAAYHEIAIQEITGWTLLASLFDHAEARGLAGTAQQVIDPMLELRTVLSSEERASLAYYRGRASLLAGRARTAARLFGAISVVAQAQTLAGLACRGLGQAMGMRQRWEEGLQHLAQSRVHLSRSGDAFSLACTWLATGDLYREMAEFNGGIVRPETIAPHPPEFLAALFYLPEQSYQWLARRIQRLPFIDVGYNYQNWLAARLMLAAAAAYRQAERWLQGIDSPQTLFEIRLGLVGVYAGVGMTRRAGRLLGVLEGWDYTARSDFRRADTLYWRAEILRQLGDLEPARRLLVQVVEIRTAYRHQRGVAAAYARLGRVAVQSGARTDALTFYRQAAAAYGAGEQPLSRTRMLNRIVDLGGEPPPEETGERVYLARFPTLFAGLYRALAFAVVAMLQITVLLLLIAGLFLMGIFEGQAVVLGSYNSVVLGALLVWPLVAGWLFQIVYLAAGLLISFTLPIRRLARDPPSWITLNGAGVTISGGRIQAALRFPYAHLSAVQAVTYRIRRQPIALISHLDLLADGTRTPIGGLTTDFRHLWQDLEARIGAGAWQTLAFRLLPSRWGYVLGLGLILIGGVVSQQILELGAYAPDLQQPAEWKPVHLTGVLVGAVGTGFLLFPLVTFWRLWLHVWRWRRRTPPDHPGPPLNAGQVVIYLGTALWTLLALGAIYWLVIVWLRQRGLGP